MRVQLRETGSILVSASEPEVLDVLARHARGATLVSPGRIASAESTYVVRGVGARTQVIHARTNASALPRVARDREQLRQAVRSELFDLQRIFALQAAK